MSVYVSENQLGAHSPKNRSVEVVNIAACDIEGIRSDRFRTRRKSNKNALGNERELPCQYMSSSWHRGIECNNQPIPIVSSEIIIESNVVKRPSSNKIF